jgi:hypothetical protein
VFQFQRLIPMTRVSFCARCQNPWRHSNNSASDSLWGLAGSAKSPWYSLWVYHHALVIVARWANTSPSKLCPAVVQPVDHVCLVLWQGCMCLLR